MRQLTTTHHLAKTTTITQINYKIELGINLKIAKYLKWHYTFQVLFSIN